MRAEKLNKKNLNEDDFIKIYDDFQDLELEFMSIQPNPEHRKSPNAMINAIRTFDHQGIGFISINELKFSI
jgi:Ca2+-binding EF-hand superfamily protein